MRTARFYTPELETKDSIITLSQETSHHISTVLRMKQGESIILFCGDGFDYHAEITEPHKKKTTARITDKVEVSNEAKTKIHLIQSLCRGEKMDFIIQKATELGVSEITPVICERTQGARDSAKLTKKYEHWHKVMISACEQSGRAVLPTLHPAVKLNEALSSAQASRKIILHTNIEPGSRVDARDDKPTTPDDTFAIAVGPEGGFTDQEVETALFKGFKARLLGNRILRTETAALAAISTIHATRQEFLI